MRLLFFDDFRLGVLRGDTVIDVSDLTSGIPNTGAYNLMTGLIERFPEYREKIQAETDRGCGLPVSQVRVRPPLPKPYNIVGMAVNYLEEGPRAVPQPMNAFHKSPSGVIGDGDSMVLPDVAATVFEGEAEMGVVIGKKASRVSAAEAMDYVFGYVNIIDGSARGIPPSTNVFYQMKSRETFAPLGPVLVTADEVPDPHSLQVRLWVNGVLKQDFNTRAMAHRIPECIEWITSVHALEPGDVIATGTDHRGLGALQDGDLVEMETEGLGRLRFHVRDDLKRSWDRETRIERERKGLDGRAPQLSGKYMKK